MSSVMLGTMLLCFALSVSVAVSIGIASILGLLSMGNVPMVVIPKEMFSSLDKFPLLAVPFFILAGKLMEEGGISNRLVDFAKSLVGGIQGGLAASCVITCLIFAAVSGLRSPPHSPSVPSSSPPWSAWDTRGIFRPLCKPRQPSLASLSRHPSQ